MPTTRELVLAALLARLRPLAALVLRDLVQPERIPSADPIHGTPAIFFGQADDQAQLLL